MGQGWPDVLSAVRLSWEGPAIARRVHHSARDWLGLVIQAAFLLAILGVIAVIAVTTRSNFHKQQIPFGFDFLWAQTGWDVVMSLVPHSATDPYWRTIVAGLLNTILLSTIGLTLALLFGTLLGFLSVSTNPLLNGVCRIYVSVFRNVPQILQLFFWYALTRQLPPVRQAIALFPGAYLSNRGLYLPSLDIANAGPWLLAAAGAVLVALLPPFRPLTAAAILITLFLVLFESGVPTPTLHLDTPVLQGFNFTGGLTLLPEFVALVVALVIYNVAFIAEIVRAAVAAVPTGQTESARSLGLPPFLVFRKIILPQALRIALPPLTSQAISLTKSTSLAVAIGFTEFFQVITLAINHTGQSIQNIAILMVGYAALSLVLVGSGSAVANAYRWPHAR